MNQRIKTASYLQSLHPRLRIDECLRTPCTCAVLGFFGIDKNSFKFCQYVTDMRNIFRQNGWKTISKRIPVGLKWDELGSVLGRGFYFVSIEGHVFLIYISDDGAIRVDVDTNEKCRYSYPEVEGVYKIELKK